MENNEEPPRKFAMKERDGKPPFSYMTDVFFTHATNAAIHMAPLIGESNPDLLDSAILHIMKFAHTEGTGLELIAEAAGFILLYYQRIAPQFSKPLTLRSGQITLQAMTDYANVRAGGAVKYDRNNWKLGIPFTFTIDAVLRHLFAFVHGQYFDADSKVCHLGHVLCDLEHMLFFIGKEDMIKVLDNRFKDVKKN
jgi:hypothetical protein